MFFRILNLILIILISANIQLQALPLEDSSDSEAPKHGLGLLRKISYQIRDYFSPRDQAALVCVSKTTNNLLQASPVEDSSDSEAPKHILGLLRKISYQIYGYFLSDSEAPKHILELGKISYQIYDYLSPRDQAALACVSKTMNKSIEAYRILLLQSVVPYFEEGRLFDNHMSHFLSNFVEKRKEFKTSLIASLNDRIVRESFLVALTGSPIIPYLMDEFAILELQHFEDNTNSAGQLYSALFNSTLPTDNENLKTTAIKHLQVILSAYVSKDAVLQQQGVQKFFQQEIDTVIKGLDLKRRQRPYFSFLSPNADFQTLQSQAYNIIITDEQIQNNAIKLKLSEFFQANPSHTLILSIGDSNFVENGCLRLRSRDLPPFIKQLCLRNPSGNVTSIGKDFLSDCTDLTSFDTSGLTQVTSIGNGFLRFCKDLNAEDKKKIEIFLKGRQVRKPQGLSRLDQLAITSRSTGLISFGAPGSAQITLIGGGFLHSGESALRFTGLTSFDAKQARRYQGLSTGYSISMLPSFR